MAAQQQRHGSVEPLLGGERLQACSDELGVGRRPELIDRVGIPDPKLFSLMTLLASEAASHQPVNTARASYGASARFT